MDSSSTDSPSVITDNSLATLKLRFESSKQFWRLFRRGFIRWLITFVLISLLYVTIRVVSKDQDMTEGEKQFFNAVSLYLVLMIGMSLTFGFEAMAIDLRWWILSRKERSLRDIDTILHADSLTTVSSLLGRKVWYKIRHFTWDWDLGTMIMSCLLWVLLNIGAQVAIASVGLTYSVDTAEKLAHMSRGNVSYPNMTQFFPVKLPNGRASINNLGAQQYTANSFGMMALNLWSTTQTIPEPATIYKSGLTADLFGVNKRSWVFVFMDTSSDGLTSAYSDRTIESTSSCESYPVLEGGNGNFTNLNISKKGNSEGFKVKVPIAAGPDQTTFFTNPFTTCGEGCSIVEALEASANEPWYYKCNITVGPVINAQNANQEVSLSLRHMSSAAIALQGYAANPELNDTQYRIYVSESTCGYPRNGSAVDFGYQISYFAIGAIAAAANSNNPSIYAIGDRPVIGTQLKITQHALLLGLLIGLVSVQAICFITTAFVANKVVVKDESIFSTASILRPVMNSLGGHGNVAEGEQICDVLSHLRLRYTAVQDEKDRSVWKVGLSNAERLKRFPDLKMYD
ncbi:uncharacterized protein EAE97_001619 [Botrytis byssoidea]|uniref:Uncharacterized protein n=1 Tax=Botrytis byssoidea TaxID=139641 RepID=A0A9P5IY69_9HELO|nr:uncharacterized protein EAE97_001619 [Botrytis byssoidea]KAF7952122.1 hypothetical protein EAE97_001619 [Botrytis byssoidea]